MSQFEEKIAQLDLPESFKEMYQKRKQVHQSRFDRLMAQHQQMKHEERVRALKDGLAIFAGLLIVILLIVKIFKEDD